MTQPASLNNQIGSVTAALAKTPRTAGRGQRQSVLDFQLRNLEAALATLRWLQSHEVEIRAFLALPVETRAALISHGPLVTERAAQLLSEALAVMEGQAR